MLTFIFVSVGRAKNFFPAPTAILICSSGMPWFFTTFVIWLAPVICILAAKQYHRKIRHWCKHHGRHSQVVVEPMGLDWRHPSCHWTYNHTSQWALLQFEKKLHFLTWSGCPWSHNQHFPQPEATSAQSWWSKDTEQSSRQRWQGRLRKISSFGVSEFQRDSHHSTSATAYLEAPAHYFSVRPYNLLIGHALVVVSKTREGKIRREIVGFFGFQYSVFPRLYNFHIGLHIWSDKRRHSAWIPTLLVVLLYRLVQPGIDVLEKSTEEDRMLWNYMFKTSRSNFFDLFYDTWEKRDWYEGTTRR